MGKVLGASSIPKARKEHQCWLCFGPIQIGAFYLRWAWLDDNRINTMRAHIACDRYAKDYIAEYADGVDWGAVLEHLRDRLRVQGVGDHWWRTIAVDDAEAARLRTEIPDFAAVVDEVVASISREIEEEA